MPRPRARQTRLGPSLSAVSADRSASTSADRNKENGAMPHYVSLMRWTSTGRMGLPAWRDRVEEGERMIEEAGGTLVGVWVTLGQYDVVEVFEAPSDEVALEIITKLQRHGAEETETLRAFTRDEAEAIIRKL
jgi:uncharacterized protein with GYD domain